MRKRLHRIAGMVGSLVLAVGMVVHLSCRDFLPGLSVIFYALPLPLIAVGWLGLALWHVRQRLLMSPCLTLAFVTALWWQATSYQPPGHASSSRAGLKVLYWNMAHHRLPSADLQCLVDQHRPDIVGLGEVGLRFGDPNPLISKVPPGYTALKPEYGMGLLVRGTANVGNLTKLKRRSKFIELDVTVDGRTWHVILVDGEADPLRSREPLLTQVLQAASGKGKDTLVMGDFNTPVESGWFDSWRTAGLHHATEGARSGFRETWPNPWPVLTIDHIWSSPDAPPLRMQRLKLNSSDHLAVLAEVALGK